MSQKVNIGIVGATGQVGVAMRQILLEREFPADRAEAKKRISSTGKLRSIRIWRMATPT